MWAEEDTLYLPRNISRPDGRVFCEGRVKCLQNRRMWKEITSEDRYVWSSNLSTYTRSRRKYRQIVNSGKHKIYANSWHIFCAFIQYFRIRIIANPILCMDSLYQVKGFLLFDLCKIRVHKKIVLKRKNLIVLQ